MKGSATPRYFVNTTPRESGAHEVHKTDSDCAQRVHSDNRLDLGYHARCDSAVVEAKLTFPFVDGCGDCAPDCHKG